MQSAAPAATRLATRPLHGPGGAHWRLAPLSIFLIALVTILSRAIWFGDPAPDTDEQLYSLIGARMLHGALPYVDLWDRKPFGLFLLFAFAHAIGGPGPLAYQLLATVFAAVGGWQTCMLARDLSDRWTAIGAGALYPLLIYAYGSFSGQSEVFFLPLIMGALIHIRRMGEGRAERRALYAMLLAGAALQIKYSVLPQCLFLGLAALWHFRSEPPRRVVVRGAQFAFAGLLPTIAVACFYAFHHAFDAFYYANFVSIFERAAAQSGRFPREHLRALLPMMAMAGGGLYLTLRNASERNASERNAAGFRLVAGWSVSILISITMLPTVYLYYYAAFVPAAILLALPLLSVKNALRWAPLVLVTGATLTLLNVPRHFESTRHARHDLARMARLLEPFVARQHCLFVFDGPASLYRITGSCIPTRFAYPDHLNNPLERFALGVSQEGEVARILAGRPGAIVVADDTLAARDTPARRFVASEIERSYRPIAVAHVRERTYRAWSRREH